jgi:hypothetical protein
MNLLKLKSIYILFFLLTIVGCSKKDDSTNTAIEGRWTAVKSYVASNPGVTYNYNTSTSYIEFRSNVLIQHLQGVGNGLAFPVVYISEEVFTRDGDKLYVNSNTFKGYWKIDEITTTKLVISEYDNGVYDQTIECRR